MVALPFQPSAQLAVVVDLAVEGDDDDGVFIGDRLVTARGVDDGEAADTEGGGAGLEEALVIGPRWLRSSAMRPSAGRFTAPVTPPMPHMNRKR